MPILNYTTKIDVFKTLGEIQRILVNHGAKRIIQDYDDNERVASILFMIDTPSGPRGIRLPANVDGVLRALKADGVKTDYERAERVAWRIVKDWLEAQMAILEAQMVQMDEIFLPYMLDNGGSRTLYEVYRENQLLLSGGEG